MTVQTIRSGWFSTPTNTPTGTRKKIAVDNPYLTKDDYVQSPEATGMAIDASSPFYANGQLDKVILRASAWVNRFCDCWFDTQTIDETRTGFLVRPYNPQLITVTLQNSPYQMIHTIYIQVLKWFIQIDTSASTGYLQDFPDYGYYKIVPMLSTAGTGVSTPLPAEIVDRVPLGVLWTRYTFGFGTPQTGFTLAGAVDGSNTQFQAPMGNRLWAPDQTFTLYDNAVAVATTAYTVDYPNGMVTFTTAPTAGHAITADFTTNESIPAEIREAVILLTTDFLFRGTQNPGGVDSINMTAYSTSYGNSVLDRVKEMLMPYKRNRMKII